jgi:hypothetical protein
MIKKIASDSKEPLTLERVVGGFVVSTSSESMWLSEAEARKLMMGLMLMGVKPGDK